MALPLRYGDPPQEKDCTDLGSVKADLAVMVAAPDSGGYGLVGFEGGLKKPEWAVVRQIISQIRGNYDLPVKVKIDQVGKLLLGQEGWVVEREEGAF